MFHIRLKNADICQPWYKSVHVSNFYFNHSNVIVLHGYYLIAKYGSWIVQAPHRGGSHWSLWECLPRANPLKPSFSCGSSPNLITYRNTLIGTHIVNFNATQPVGLIQDWVTSAPQINIKDYAVWLDSSCPIAVASLKEPECWKVWQCPCANDPNVVKCVEFLGNESVADCINSCVWYS